MKPQPLVQKYPWAYYCWVSHPGCETEHYMMHKGIRTRHGSRAEVEALCKKANTP